MPATSMNHFTILTDDLEATLVFYRDLLGLHAGPRPPFSFPGAWLYAQGSSDAILHVVAGRERKDLGRGTIDHMAFSARGLADTLALLRSRGIEHDLRRLPGALSWQLFFFDPNGARVELDFDGAEAAPAEA